MEDHLVALERPPARDGDQALYVPASATPSRMRHRMLESSSTRVGHVNQSSDRGARPQSDPMSLEQELVEAAQRASEYGRVTGVLAAEPVPGPSRIPRGPRRPRWWQPLDRARARRPAARPARADPLRSPRSSRSASSPAISPAAATWRRCAAQLARCGCRSSAAGASSRSAAALELERAIGVAAAHRLARVPRCCRRRPPAGSIMRSAITPSPFSAAIAAGRARSRRSCATSRAGDRSTCGSADR